MSIDSANKDHLEKLYLTTGKLAMSKVQYMVKDTSLSQDIVHDVFLKLHQSKTTFPCSKSAYKWIYVTSHNLAIDHLRSSYHGSQSKQVEMIDLADPTSAEDRILNRDYLHKITNRLGKFELQLIFYKYVDGLKTSELVELTKHSERTLRRKFAGIHSKLKRFKSEE